MVFLDHLVYHTAVAVDWIDIYTSMEGERAQLCELPCRLKKIVASRVVFFTIKTCRKRSNIRRW